MRQEITISSSLSPLGSKPKGSGKKNWLRTAGYSFSFVFILGLLYSGHNIDSVVVAEQASNVSVQLNGDKPSIDQAAATSLAADLATTANLPIANNVSNQAISMNAKSQLAQTDDSVISKPQIMQPTTAVTRGISTYKAIAGDTVDSVAAKFSLKKDTIKWSNNLDSDALEPGRDLTIPPTDGLVYVAQEGDTVASIAQKHSADPERVILYNTIDAGSPVAAGTQVVVPGGVVVAAPAPVAPAASNYTTNSGYGGSVNMSASMSAGNRYDYGYCTWYAFNRRAALGRPIGGLWGNASSWASLARSSGFLVNGTPAVGAVMQTASGAGGYGHVAVVESVNEDGSIYISEMNYAGWNVKSSRTVPASQVGSYSYIH